MQFTTKIAKATLWTAFAVCALGQQASVSPPQTDVTEQPTFKAGVADVRVDVQVLDGTRLVSNLQFSDFTVYDNEAQQPIKSFSFEREPLSLLLVLDVSGSMKEFLQQLSSISRIALQQLRPEDQVGVMLFSRTARVQTPLTKDLSKLSEELRSAVLQHDQGLGNGTQINQALLDATEYMAKEAPKTGRRAVLMVTDNLGINYQLGDARIIRALQDSDVVCNAIVVGKGRRPEKETRFANPAFSYSNIFNISEETGGDALRSEKASESFPLLIEKIRSRYSIHFASPGGKPGEFRQIRVDLHPIAKSRLAKPVLRYRKGYFAE